MIDADHIERARAVRVAALDCFIHRAEARAWLFGAGELGLIEAVDELQATAERDHLVERLGADIVQEILARAFAPYREVAQ